MTPTTRQPEPTRAASVFPFPQATNRSMPRSGSPAVFFDVAKQPSNPNGLAQRPTNAQTKPAPMPRISASALILEVHHDHH